ncbi:MAG: ABC transporter substrate-binding protein [Defluviitaleaceae bacterium]|nr:ABC transporter substrate-binding protein [Defluviitaleaceae bacterium]
MKKKTLALILASAFIIGACTPTAAPPATPAPDTGTAAPAAPAQPAEMPPEPPPQDAPLGRGITVAIAIETPSVVPARHTSLVAGFKNALTHNGLFRAHYTDLSPVPELISGWRAISDSVFEFDLIQGVLFHNGEELTAYDVVASMEYVRNYPYARANHLSIVGWEVVDRHTFRLDTGEPNAMMFFDLTSHANNILPASLIASGHDFTVDPVGTGPFVFEEWRSGDSLRFTAFEDYFDENRAARVEYVEWRIIPEGSSRTISLETGEVDYIVDVALPDVPRLEADPNITVFQRPGNMMQFFSFNNDRPQFQNVYVRRAIDMAFDREAMVIASLDGFGEPVYSTMPPMFAGSSQEGTRSFDPEGARALLAEQGIAPGDLSFDMLVFAEDQRRRAEVAQANLADIGIEATITMMDQATWLTLTTGDNFETTFANQTQPNLLALMRAIMHRDSINGPNRARWNNDELSDLIDQALATIDESARNAILQEASRVANEDVGFIGTNTNVVVRAFNANLISPEIAPSGAMFLNLVYWVD